MSWVPYVTMFLLALCGLLLIFIILLQRGRGGGLAGALGGMGGQSAFGTKAGDVFTRITIVVAILWVLSAGLMGLTARAAQNAKSRAFLESGADAAASGGASEATGTVKDNAAPPNPAAPPTGVPVGETGSTTGAAAAPVTPPATPPASVAPPANQSPGEANKQPAPQTPAAETSEKPDAEKAPEAPKP
jgi:preprotein translocase subunit SecG